MQKHGNLWLKRMTKQNVPKSNLSIVIWLYMTSVAPGHRNLDAPSSEPMIYLIQLPSCNKSIIYICERIYFIIRDLFPCATMWLSGLNQ